MAQPHDDDSFLQRVKEVVPDYKKTLSTRQKVQGR